MRRGAAPREQDLATRQQALPFTALDFYPHRAIARARGGDLQGQRRLVEHTGTVQFAGGSLRQVTGPQLQVQGAALRTIHGHLCRDVGRDADPWRAALHLALGTGTACEPGRER